MKLSVVILNYNVRYFLEQCLYSVEEAIRPFDAEIIVVDNASADGSGELMKERFPHIQYIYNKENIGFSKANNQGVELAKGEYVCILNPDTAVTNDTFIKTISYAESLDDLGALGVQLVDGTGNFLPESKRNLPTPRRAFLKLFGTRKTSGYYAESIEQAGTGPVDVLVGAFMLMKREVFRQVGGFDEDYFMYGEDIDLSYKLLNAGYRNHYLGSVSIIHYKGESTTRDSVYNRRFYGAMRIFFKKHYKGNYIMRLMVYFAVVVLRMAGRNGSSRSNGLKQPENVFLFSEELALRSSLSEVIDAPIKTTAKSVLSHENFQDSMLVFDGSYLSYSQIITVMRRLSNRGNIFRIVPAGSRFLIGSDRSDHKGTVLVF